MIAFEVHVDGEHLCTASAGEHGVLASILTFVSHSPAKLTRWSTEGRGEAVQQTDLRLEVRGMEDGGADVTTKWLDVALQPGAEVLLRVVRKDSVHADERRADPA